ncbi:MAG: hypothetical protein DI626_05155, partial [Micavibrio aeruginosavorus]
MSNSKITALLATPSLVFALASCGPPEEIGPGSKQEHLKGNSYKGEVLKGDEPGNIITIGASN